MELAGRNSGLTGERAEVIEQTGARIVADMIQAGQGGDVLKLWAVTATKTGAGKGEQGGKSALASALERVSGQLSGPDSSRDQTGEAESDGRSKACAQGASAAQSVAPANQGHSGHQAASDGDQVGAISGELVAQGAGPYFAPQRTLPLADPSAGPGRAGRPGAPPHPPLPASRDRMEVGAAPSEKISGGRA